MNDKDCCPHPSKRNILYVVFHGELAFVDIPGAPYIRVYAPKVPTHVYMAGPWLGENQIPLDTTLALQGVYDGAATIGSSDILVLGKRQEARPVAAHFELRIPRPDNILDGYLITLHEGAFKIGKEPLALPSYMDLRPIFKYTMKSDLAYLSDLDDVADLNGQTPYLTNWSAGLGVPGYYSLHVFAEEDIILNDKDHTSEATEGAGRLLGVNQVRADDTKTDVPSVFPTYHGLHPSEYQLRLSYRTLILKDIGTQLRKHVTCLEWKEKSVLGELKRDNHASCGPMGG